jgi:hypothetical protein
MEKIVILKGPSVDSPGEYVLTECLKIMFPDCEVEILSTLPENSPDGGRNDYHISRGRSA